jgi:hypothetical protein
LHPSWTDRHEILLIEYSLNAILRYCKLAWASQDRHAMQNPNATKKRQSWCNFHGNHLH